MKKISVIGAGNVGSIVALMTASWELAHVVILDRDEELAKGKALDIAQSIAAIPRDYRVSGTSDYKDIEGSDIVVITAGAARKPGMSRDDLLEINSKIVKQITAEVAKRVPDCIIVVVTNPVNTMSHLAYQISGFDKNKVIGMAGILDGARFRYFISKKLNIGASEIVTQVLGDHGALMVPLVDHCQVNGRSIREFLSTEEIAEIVEKTRHAGSQIVSLLKTGSAYFAPGTAVAHLIKAILRDEKKTIPCAVYLDGEYQTQDAFVGVPIVVGSKGIERIIEMPLTEREQTELKESVEHITQRWTELSTKLDKL